VLGPHFGGAINQLFGTNQTFSATLEFQPGGKDSFKSHAGPDGPTFTISYSGQLSFDTGKSRFEMNTSESPGVLAGTRAMMKAMGKDWMIAISRPDLKMDYLIYPNLHSYAAMTQTNAYASAAPTDFKVAAKELGKEVVDGHDCIKNQITLTDKDGVWQEFTVWNATDLKNFPVKIVTGDQGKPGTILFKRVSFDPPADRLFEAPTDCVKYDNLPTMMRTEVMNKLTVKHDKPATSEPTFGPVK
jgi:hypothetical protein